ncbi:MAG TPA: sugar phosphate isomerase/epimerase family protein [bacterium]|nr:sugar phosphate isomerase/epimerase family protein [bacterium]
MTEKTVKTEKTALFGLNGATTGRADLQTDIAVAAAAGYDAVELRDAKLDAYLRAGGSLAGVRVLCRDSNLSVAGLNALEDSTLTAGPARQALLERCRQMCAWARDLACPFVIAVPSFLGGEDPKTMTAQTVDALRQMGAVAGEYGVRIGFEFIGFPTCSVRTLGEAQRIVVEVADPAVGLVIDAFHFFAGGSTWTMLDAVDPHHLFVVHLDDAEDRALSDLTDRHRLLPGDGVFPLKEFVRRLQASGYSGVYSLELFRPEYWQWDAFHLARVGLEKMQLLFGDL